MQERREIVDLVLGDDGACAVRQEAIDHHPVEARGAPHLRRGRGEQRLEIGRRLQRAGRLPRLAQHDRRGSRIFRARLQLDDRRAVQAMRDHVESMRRLRAFAAPDERGLDDRSRKGGAHEIGRPFAESLRQRPPQHRPRRPAEQRRQIARRLHDLQRIRVDGQQHAMRLDRARNMDRLTIAIGGVDKVGHRTTRCAALARSSS